ncbi:ATP/GTP-binding protein [Streptomyces sp. NPDC052051]|uniref:ATP/GTP-binding protein n=1 Tax=Streptomyces sp. NPDC052051 TaxID=3154649 RepID=UPI0034442513
MLTLPRSAAAAPALALALGSTGLAYAGGDPTVAPPTDCGDMRVCIGVGTSGSGTKRSGRIGGKHTSKSLSGKKRTCSAYFSGSQPFLDTKGPGEYDVPCEDPELGSFAGGCYYKRASPQPPVGDPAWKGHKASEGAIYQRSCPGGFNDDPAMAEGYVWMARLPAAAPVDPAVLAQRAVDKMKLAGPDIASPRAAGRYTVGVPVWMWVNRSATTYGPNSASATAGGVTVTATAEVSKIAWSMGDGSSVTCTGPGTPYSASEGMAESPTCGHVYSKTSAGQRSGKYQVTATSTWRVNWQVTDGGGETGQLTETRQSQMQVATGELQVVR